MESTNTIAAWPRLGLDEWAPTQTTLQRWTQIVGKTRLALAPMQNHWWQVVLYVTERGLTTSPIPYDDGRSFDVSFDFASHKLIARTSEGESRTIPLVAQSVADFYAAYMEMLRSLGIEVKIKPVPMEMADTMRFTEDRTHASYDPDAVHRFHQVLVRADRTLKEFRARFLGKSSPSHFWWGGFDLACTRFSGRPAPLHPGGIPNCPDYVMIEGYSHECISAGWWVGTAGGPVSEPAFYAYSYPEPPGCDVAPVRPEGAYYHPVMREWILPYESVRTSPDPSQALLDFLQSTYETAATLAKWDRKALERPANWTPPPSAARGVKRVTATAN
ncbi:MAG TPA: DUF5996 family protein [Gemmatimonadaceae bacterium]|nr:DUF5996 family protein [Gemmatimonadaceae bacterium]